MPVKLEILPTFMLYRQVLRVTTCSPWVRSSFGGVARSQARATRERSFIFSTLLPDNGVTNRPFAARHSRGTKPPCWRAKVTLGQDKQRQLLSKIMFAFLFVLSQCDVCSPAWRFCSTWMASCNEPIDNFEINSEGSDLFPSFPLNK